MAGAAAVEMRCLYHFDDREWFDSAPGRKPSGHHPTAWSHRLRISPFTLRTMKFGSKVAEQRRPGLSDRTLDCGIHMVDTAKAYARGASKEIVGSRLDLAAPDLVTKLLKTSSPTVGMVVSTAGNAAETRPQTDEAPTYTTAFEKALLNGGELRP